MTTPMHDDRIRDLITEGRKHDAHLREPPAPGSVLRIEQRARQQESVNWAIENLAWLLDALEQLRAKAAKLEEEGDPARSLAARIAQREVARMRAVMAAAGPPPERAAELRSQLAAINRGSQQLVFEASDPGAAEPQASSLVADIVEQVRACVAGPPAPGAIQLVPIASMQTPQERIAEIEAELVRARRAVAFFTTTTVADGFDWEAWLEGRIEGPPPEVGRHERIADLEAALRGLVARVDRAGGYASPEEQDVLRRARRVLGGAAAR